MSTSTKTHTPVRYRVYVCVCVCCEKASLINRLQRETDSDPASLSGVPVSPSPGAAALHLQPGVVHRRRHGGADGGGADVADDAERLLQGEVHPQHLVAVLRLLLGLLHQRVLIRTRVELSQQLSVDEVFRLSREGKTCWKSTFMGS